MQAGFWSGSVRLCQGCLFRVCRLTLRLHHYNRLQQLCSSQPLLGMLRQVNMRNHSMRLKAKEAPGGRFGGEDECVFGATAFKTSHVIQPVVLYFLEHVSSV